MCTITVCTKSHVIKANVLSGKNMFFKNDWTLPKKPCTSKTEAWLPLYFTPLISIVNIIIERCHSLETLTGWEGRGHLTTPLQRNHQTHISLYGGSKLLTEISLSAETG